MTRSADTPTTRRMPLTEFRTNLSAVIKSNVSRHKEHIIVENSGVPIAVVMDIDDYEDQMELRNPQVQRTIEESSRDFAAGRFRPAEDLIPEIESIATAPRRMKK